MFSEARKGCLAPRHTSMLRSPFHHGYFLNAVAWIFDTHKVVSFQHLDTATLRAVSLPKRSAWEHQLHGGCSSPRTSSC